MSTEEQQKAIQKINAFKNDYQMMSERLSEVQMEYSEHMAVLDALKGLEKGRKCHRLIGGVLVERTVEQVVPAIETNLAGVQTIDAFFIFNNREC